MSDADHAKPAPSSRTAHVIATVGIFVAVVTLYLTSVQARMGQVQQERRSVMGDYYGALEQISHLQPQICGDRSHETEWPVTAENDPILYARWNDAYSAALSAYGRIQVFLPPDLKGEVARVNAYVVDLDVAIRQPAASACEPGPGGATSAKKVYDDLQKHVGARLYPSFLQTARPW